MHIINYKNAKKILLLRYVNILNTLLQICLWKKIIYFGRKIKYKYYSNY